MFQLKKKKMYEKSIGNLENQIMNLDQQCMMVKNAATTKVAPNAYVLK